MIEACGPSDKTLTKEELIASARREGIDVTDRQFDRWRSAGLVVVEREWSTPGQGSEARYSSSMLANLREIQRLRRQKRDLEWTGWQLWWRNHEVDESCWRPAIEKASGRLTKFVAWIVRTIAKRDQSDAYADALAAKPVPIELFPVAAQRVLLNHRLNHGEENLGSILGRLVETIADHENASGWSSDDPDTLADANGLLRILGLARADSDQFQGSGLNAQRGLQTALRALRGLADVRKLDLNNKEDRLSVFNARDDLREMFDGVRDFRESVAWVYGENAFGLKMAVRLLTESTPDIAARMIAGWVSMRARGELPRPDEIQEMARHARQTLEASRDLQSFLAANPKYKQVLSSKRVRQAFRGPPEYAKWLQEIREIRRA
jgi:hypothetical protein